MYTDIYIYIHNTYMYKYTYNIIYYIIIHVYVYIYIYVYKYMPGISWDKQITLQAATRTRIMDIMDAGRELTALTSVDGFSACCAYLTTDLGCDGGESLQ